MPLITVGSNILCRLICLACQVSLGLFIQCSTTGILKGHLFLLWSNHFVTLGWDHFFGLTTRLCRSSRGWCQLRFDLSLFYLKIAVEQETEQLDSWTYKKSNNHQIPVNHYLFAYWLRLQTSLVVLHCHSGVLVRTKADNTDSFNPILVELTVCTHLLNVD